MRWLSRWGCRACGDAAAASQLLHDTISLHSKEVQLTAPHDKFTTLADMLCCMAHAEAAAACTNKVQLAWYS